MARVMKYHVILLFFHKSSAKTPNVRYFSRGSAKNRQLAAGSSCHWQQEVAAVDSRKPYQIRSDLPSRGSQSVFSNVAATNHMYLEVKRQQAREFSVMAAAFGLVSS